MDKANEVTHQLGTSTAEMVRIFVTQIAQTGKVPLKLASEESGDLAEPWERRAAVLEGFYDPEG